MINILKFTLLLFLFSSCSLNNVGGFWTNKKELESEKLEFETLFKQESNQTKEFNKTFKFVLNKKDLKINENSKNDNNDGYVLLNNELAKIQKYNFSKIKNFYSFEPNIILKNDTLVFFNNKGSILSFNEKSKLNWMTNNYTKAEKKNGPLVSMTSFNNKLFISDNISKVYSVNLGDGKIIWSKKNESPFNSEIKFYKNKLFVVDSNNNLNCFSSLNGDLLWQHKTEKSFINSSKKLSIITKDDIVIFSNSIGDITAVDINNGSLIWQRSTFNSRIYEDIMTLKTSNLVANNSSLYFSNNKNKFYSFDLNTGTTNWIQNINSNIKPTIIGNFIFTLSPDGYFFVLDKKSGNILRISNIFNKLKNVDKEKINPTGFVSNFQNLFVSTTNGKLIIVEIKTGTVKNILKIDNDTISRPVVHNQKMYLIKDDSIVKLN